VTLREWFDYRGHVCMVFERLGLSLYDFLRKNSYRPFHADIIRAFGRQLLEAVAYLHDLGLIHTDLKPENILLQSPQYDKKTPPANSRHAPPLPSRLSPNPTWCQSCPLDEAGGSCTVPQCVCANDVQGCQGDASPILKT
jgi:serine/threonine protein kinase